MLMVGPPGAGKSMLASCLPGIMPKLTSREMLEISMIESIAGKLANGSVVRIRPFRDPHHSCSMAAMTGGGARAKPGEVTLAHNGILFLDELPEFPRTVLDSLRQPIENREVSVARVNAHVTYPARFQLVAAMNPCRCGYLSDPGKACNKAPRCANDYQSKVSGPLLDRIDINIEVPAVPVTDIEHSKRSESSNVVALRVAKARKIQEERYKESGILTNSEADGDMIQKFATPDEEGKKLVNQAVEKMGLSMRSYSKVLKVARTIADLENSEQVKKPHIAEALSYRRTNILSN